MAERFALRRICVVADRGLISAANIDMVAEAGFDQLLATRLRRDRICTEALGAIDEDTAWVKIPHRGCRAADVTLEDGTRTVVVHSDGRARRDVARTAEIIATAEAKLRALELCVRAGRLTDPAKTGAATQRILNAGGAARLFDTEIGKGRFGYHYNEDAHTYEQALAGRYVLTTSLTPNQTDTAQVVDYYRQLQAIEARFRTVGDFLRLRPIRQGTEQRVRGHVAVCVYAALMETLINHALVADDIRDPASATPTSETSTSPLPEPCATSTASAATKSAPTAAESRSPPAEALYKPEHCPPSAQTPTPGTRPPPPDPITSLRSPM